MKNRSPGFTLIEVTLAIVIGVVIIAAAVLVYNQAKASAGNSRAQAKVSALQQMVEEMASTHEGSYPSSLIDMNVTFKVKRPDDWNKSPWGGVVGSSYNPSAADGYAVATRKDSTTLEFEGYATHAPSGAENAYQRGPNATIIGGMVYDYDTKNLVFEYGTDTVVGDMMVQRKVRVKGYAVYIVDQVGGFPNFIAGGKP